jgi:sporulation protein YlmC with PRC-barrel domain
MAISKIHARSVYDSRGKYLTTVALYFLNKPRDSIANYDIR